MGRNIAGWEGDQAGLEGMLRLPTFKWIQRSQVTWKAELHSQVLK